MPEMIVYNGLVISRTDSALPFLNRSFRYGDGVFESIRVRKGRVLFWQDHLSRLQRGMEVLGLEPAEELEKKFRKGVDELMIHNGVSGEGKIRIMVFRAGDPPYTPHSAQAEFVIEASSLKADPWQSPPGLQAMLYPEVKLCLSPLSPVKTCNALPYILASGAARKAGFDDAILFHGENFSECTASNLFLVREGTLFTPPLRSACLDGVMRKQVIRLARASGIAVRETELGPIDLRNTQEVFTTNTIAGIRPVLCIYPSDPGQPALFSVTEPGRVTYTLRSALLRECE